MTASPWWPARCSSPSLTGDPGLVAGAALVQQLPWLLFALLSGVYVDRLDRRRLIVSGSTPPGAAVLAGLAVTVATDTVTVPLIYVAFFLLGTGETLADSAYQAVLPSLVPDEHLERANARLMATFVVGNQLAAKPLGAYLFVVGAAVPFGFDATTFLVAALLPGGDPVAAAAVVEPGATGHPPRRHRRGAAGAVVLPPLRLLAVTSGDERAVLRGVRGVRALRRAAAGPRPGRVRRAAVGLGGRRAARHRRRRPGSATASGRDRCSGPASSSRSPPRLTLAVDPHPVRRRAGPRALRRPHDGLGCRVIVSLRQRLVPDRLRGRVGSVLRAARPRRRRGRHAPGRPAGRGHVADGRRTGRPPSAWPR